MNANQSLASQLQRLAARRPTPPSRADVSAREREKPVSAQQQRAYNLYSRVFDATTPYFGARAEMPLLYFSKTLGPKGSPVPDRAVAAAYPQGSVWSGRGRSQGVIGFPFGDMFLGHPKRGENGRQWAIDILLHELGHTFQSRNLLDRRGPSEHPNSRLRAEGGADAFASLARNRVAESLGMRAPYPYTGGYGPLGQQFLARFGRDYALRGQFQRG